MIKDSIKKRFDNMIKYSDELIEKCKGRKLEDLYNDVNFAEACCFVLGLIGEQVPGMRINKSGTSVKDDDYDEFFQKYSGIEWHEIKGARNKIFHDYDGVNMELIWDILQDIPNFKSKVLALISKDN